MTRPLRAGVAFTTSSLKRASTSACVARCLRAVAWASSARPAAISSTSLRWVR
jgi:hypothetical protein